MLFQVLSPHENVSPRTIQMYTWPAIVRNIDTVGVATGGGGKTTAYLLPLAKNLEDGIYEDLPESCGVRDCYILLFELNTCTHSRKVRMAIWIHQIFLGICVVFGDLQVFERVRYLSQHHVSLLRPVSLNSIQFTRVNKCT